ncbi:hypothetical protein HNQ78_002956 [Phycisphaera mikurensis]|nr:hypothetical protein [Phycisphaera mikurensis]
MLWVARREKQIGPLAFRVWWAVLEMRCRRDVAGLGGGAAGREAYHGVAELQRLLGVERGPGSMKPLRAAIRELEAVGLLVWSDTRPQLATSPDQYRGDTDGVFTFLREVENRRRLLPVPRRWVRWLAAGQSRARSGAALVSLIRCLYVRDKRLDPNGSWAATAAGPLLGLSDRSLQGARRELVREGLLLAHATPPWYLSRYGARISINLRWGGASPRAAGGEAPPRLREAPQPRDARARSRDQAASVPTPHGSGSSGRAARSGAVSSAPLHEHPSSSSKEEEFKHQQPPAGEGDGVSIEKQGKKGKQSERRHGLHLRPEDLRDENLFAAALDRAVEAGKVEPGDRGRLRWWGAREHALRITAQKGGSPLKLMAWMLHRRRWDLITDGDESDALERRAAAARSRSRRASVSSPRPPQPAGGGTPSADAKLLASARAACQRHRQGPHVLHQLLRKAAPGWTPSRERAASEELDAARLARVRAAASLPAMVELRDQGDDCMFLK